ncbi:MAG TPA: hypothetical protein VK689_05505, partial [Armatimonadota bacterium]|nr:hypothetical protein [Armatimonadota bacterium]
TGVPAPGGLAVDPVAPSAEPQPALPDLNPPPTAVRPIAQLWNSYILAEGASGLLIIDQHLAHERVLFDRLRAAPEGEGAASQRLAVPVTLQLNHREALFAGELLPELTRIGFVLEPFGRDAHVIRAVPPFVQPGSELTTLRQLLDELQENRQSGGPASPRLLPDRVAATAACNAAVKKGSRLAMEEVRQLLEDLGRTSNPHTCPHGCPISVQVSYQELLKRFKRI